MRTFMIDTNIWAYWYDSERYPKEHANIEKRVQRLLAAQIADQTPQQRLGISPITWGEISVGIKRNSPETSSIQVAHLHFVKGKNPWVVPLDTHTAEKYGELRGLLPRETRSDKMADFHTWLEIGSRENDLWIAAQAIVRNLILVTHDKLTHIREIAGSELHIEDWAR